jgi:hypothetical protein
VGKELQSAPKWHPNCTLTEEAMETLWERAATRILEEEDKHNLSATPKTVWKGLHEDYPDLYPGNMPPSLTREWHKDPHWLTYLAFRRQEHLIRTMPTRQHIMKYMNPILELSGGEVVRRLLTDPESISNKDLLTAIKASTSALASLEKDVKTAAGVETGKKVPIAAFQFMQSLPEERKAILAAALVDELFGNGPEIVDGECEDA